MNKEAKSSFPVAAFIGAGVAIAVALGLVFSRSTSDTGDLEVNKIVFAQACQDLVKAELAQPSTAQFPGMNTVKGTGTNNFTWGGKVSYENTARTPQSSDFACISENGAAKLSVKP